MYTTNKAVRANFTFEIGDVEEKQPKKQEPLGDDELDDRYRNYLIRVYLQAFIFIVVAFIHWYIVTSSDEFRQFIRNNQTYLAYCFGYAILLLVFFTFNESVRRVTLLDYVIVIFIVEIFIMCTCIFAAYTRWYLILICAICVGVLFTICIGSAFILPFDLTNYLPMMIVSSFVLFCGAVLFLMLYALTKIGWTLICFMSLMSIVLIFFIIFHGQSINGGYVISFSQEDSLLGSLVLFLDFITLFTLIYVFPELFSDQYKVK